MQLEQATLNTINEWLNGNYDDTTKNEIQSLLNQEAYTELTDSFYRDLEFGTGGLRGIMGPGSNRINKYTIGTATQGLANYLNKKYHLYFGETESETLSGYIIHHHEMIPKIKERIIIDSYEFDIINVSDTRIEMVKIKRLK